ncbi:sentrin-specific protease 7-like isoform X4 [Halichondria panicea]|uniref:sentrin-specific protease 7-like isoform X4 n=1 Tax=Halichondria panicea TaxID=6063 RepID=UPI00312B9DF0
MEFTHSRKRKQQYRPHSNPDNRDKRAAIIDDFDRGLKTPPSRSTPGHEVTVIEDDEPDQSDHGARISSGTMYDQHKTPGEYKSSSFKIPKKKLHDLTFGHDQSNETTNVGIQPMPPKSNVVDVINRAKSMKSRTTTTSKTGSTIPDFLTLAKTPYTKNKISNSMESSLPAPKKKRPFRTNPIRSESPTETTQITNFDSQKSMLWNDTCIGLEDPNSSFDTKPNSDCVRDSRKSWASISPDRDDDIASNTSSEEVDAGEIFKRPVDKKQVLPKDKTTDKAATNDVVTIHSDDDDDNDVKATTSSNFKSPLPNRFLPPKAPPKNTNDNTDKFNKLLSTTNSVLKTCSEKPTSTADSTNASSTHRNVFAKSQAASKGKCSIQVTPTFLSKEQLAMATTHAPPSTGKARDILSITDSPVLSKVEFSFEVDDEKVARTSTSSAAGTRKPLTTSRAAELPSDLARRPLKRPTQSAATPGSFYSSNGSPSNQLFSQFRSRAWGTGSSRMSSVRGNSANQVMATYGIKKPLKLKRPLPSPCSVDVDDEESLPLSVQCVQIGRLELDKVLHVELRNDVLCMKLDYEGRTETVQVSLPACFVWQLHLGEEPYIVYINVKSPEAKKIAETLSKKYHLDSDFFNPLSSNISEQCIMLRLEERPLPHLISSIIEFLTKMNVSVDQNLGTVEAKKLLNDIKPLKPSRSHGRPLSNDDVKSLVPSLNVRRSQRSRKAPVRMDPSSPITLVESIVVHNKPNVRLLAYNVPAGSKVNIEVSTHDVDTLAPGEYINDKVVDFYLRYMWYERLAERLRSKVHIFSSFFHTRLKDASRDNKELKCLQTPERQHNRVKTWTRRVDLFDKEYIVLPVCDRAHWFVAFVYKAGEFDPVRELATREAKAAKKNKKKPLKKKPNVASPVVINDTLLEGDTEEPIPQEEDFLAPGAQLMRAANGRPPQPVFGDFIQMPPSDDEGGAIQVDAAAEIPMETEDTLRIDAAAAMATVDTIIEAATDPLTTDAYSTTTSDERVHEGGATPPEDAYVDVGQPEGVVVSVEDSLEEGTIGEEVSPERELVSPERELVGDSSTEELDILTEETRPCVLVLDSLGVRRTGIVKTIRNYLTVEWRERKARGGVEELNYDLLPAKYPVIPLQNNSSDCGLFMLQYVESLLLRMEDGLTYPETSEGWGSYEKTGSKRKEIETLITELGEIQSNDLNQTTTDKQEP